MVASVAGKTTEILITILGSVTLTASLTLTAGAAFWGYLERKFRQKKVEYLQGRIRDLELMLDPERTTSGLTTQGKTHPMDRER